MLRLQAIKLNRTIIKKAIMTNSYNTSHPQMAAYIKEGLQPHTISVKNDNNKVDNITVYSISKDNLDCYVTNKDIHNFIKLFKIVLYTEFTRFEQLSLYIRSIVKICTKLNIAVPWTLPSGAIISQSYLDSTTLKIRPFGFVKSKYNFKTIIKDKFDSTKQLNATMPNLIHSLDASSIALLYKFLRANSVSNIYTIHDCFAVSANNVSLLINLLKGVYIKIYSDDIYLKTLDTHIRNTIINFFGGSIFSDDNKYIFIFNEKILYPTLDKVIDTSISII